MRDLIQRLRDHNLHYSEQEQAAAEIERLTAERDAARADERERCAMVCDGIWAGYTGEARRLEGKHATHAAGRRDGANECAAAIRAIGEGRA